MVFNEIGARDDYISKLSSNSLMLTGDSFAERYGVNFEPLQ